MTIRLMLVDDHEVVRSGLRMLLENEEDMQIVGAFGKAETLIDALTDDVVDVVLMDVGLPEMSGIEATKRIKEIDEDVAIVALTIHEDEEYFFNMLEAGASGYVPKKAAPEELITAIRTVATSEVYLYPSMAKLLVQDYLTLDTSVKDRDHLDGLTEREQEVLAHVADGAMNREIGETLSISPKTVARHRENIMQKLNLHSRTDLVKYAIRKGIIKP